MVQEQPIIRELRERERSIAWLARNIRWSYMHTWQIVTGQREPSERFIADCSRVLDLPAERLFRAKSADKEAVA